MMRAPVRANRRRAPVASGVAIPAPVAGWDAVSPLAKMPDDRAVVLDNWFPQPGYVEVRRGFNAAAGGMGSGPVESLLVYHGLTSAASKLIAAADSKLYDITDGVPLAVQTGLANNRWQWINFSTPAGKFLWCCNGADDPVHYNGSAWANPSLTISGYTGADIVHVNAHKKRLWFAFVDSTDAGYLGTEAIAGTVSLLPLGSYFTKGGYLVATATWTIDGGDGVDDKLVAISSRGQVAVFVGTDPSSVDAWALEGIYNVGPPIGRRCFTQVAGDLALINIDGVLPLSRALQVDRGSAPNIAITANINRAMNEAARNYSGNFGWELTPYPRGTMAILNVPLQQASTQHQYVMNTLHGAWCRFTGANANCWAVFNDELYFGGNDGTVYKADVGASDNGEIISATGQTAYSYYGAPGRIKHYGMIQPLLTTNADTRPAIGISTDFQDNASVGTPSTAETGEARYDDIAVYDTATYAAEFRSVTDWTGLAGVGQAASVHFRVSTGSGSNVGKWDVSKWDIAEWQAGTPADVSIQLNGFNVIFERGGFI